MMPIVRELFAHQIKDISPTVHDPNQNAEICLITLNDDSLIELVSGPVVEPIIQKGMSLYHLCYEVRDIEKTVKSWVEHGSFLLSPPKPAIVFNGKRVCFVMNKLGIFEFLEE